MAEQHVDAFRHLGGGRKGLFVVLRYVFITTAAYLVIFQTPVATVDTAITATIALALASNVVLVDVREARLRVVRGDPRPARRHDLGVVGVAPDRGHGPGA